MMGHDAGDAFPAFLNLEKQKALRKTIIERVSGRIIGFIESFITGIGECLIF